MNNNVAQTFWFYGIASFGSSIIDTIASNYLYSLKGENMWVGIAEGAQGLAQLIVAIPVGIRADRYEVSKSKMLQTSKYLGFLATVTSMVALWTVSSFQYRYWIFFASFVFAGIWTGYYDPPLEALFANSLENGDQRKKYTRMRSIISSSCSIIGPCVGLVLFWRLGDDWSNFQMEIVWQIGLGVLFLSLIPLGRFTDNIDLELNVDFTQILLPSSSSSSDIESRSGPRPKIWWIPYLCLTSNIVTALGSGMTVKFWNLFFQNMVHFSPIQVSLLTICQTILLVFLIQLSQWRNWKLRETMVTTILGLGILGTLAFKESLWTSQYLVFGLCVVRYALMNSSSSVIDSILKDHLEENRQAKWASWDSVTVSGWCASAMVGGFLCDKYGYGNTFIVTLVLQALGSIILCPVLLYES